MKNIIYAFILFSVYHESLKAEVSIQVYDRQKDGREFIAHGIIDNKPKGESDIFSRPELSEEEHLKFLFDLEAKTRAQLLKGDPEANIYQSYNKAAKYRSLIASIYQKSHDTNKKKEQFKVMMRKVKFDEETTIQANTFQMPVYLIEAYLSGNPDVIRLAQWLSESIRIQTYPLLALAPIYHIQLDRARKNLEEVQSGLKAVIHTSEGMTLKKAFEKEFLKFETYEKRARPIATNPQGLDLLLQTHRVFNK